MVDPSIQYNQKALIICYYWPPSSGGGVMRWFKMSKYWHEFGGELTVFTPDVSDYPAYDPSLLKQIPEDLEVIKTPIWEPYNLYKKFTGKKDNVYSGFLNEKKSSWKDRLAVWIRSNFFIPDARKYWIRPSVNHLKKHLKENHYDVVITSGTPHSLHLIGLALKKELDINWIADFRDPWTDIDYADQLLLTKWAEKKHKRLEKEVLQTADEVVTVSWDWKALLSKISGKDNVHVITNGFDPADFTSLQYKNPDTFTLCHLGSMNYNRNPEQLWNAIAELDQKGFFSKGLVIHLIGQVDQKILEQIQELGLEKFIKRSDFMPHREGLQELAESSVLLLLVSKWDEANGMIPGKTYEYLATGKPILAIGNKGADVERVLRDSPASTFLSYDDKANCKKAIEDLYTQFLEGKTNLVDNSYIKQYSRRELAGKFQKLIKKMVVK